LDALAREAQFMHAARIVAVPVEVASHTPRLAKASMKFREILIMSHVPVAFPQPRGTRLLSGLDGSPVVAAKEGLDKLAAQISRTVQWADCLQGCIEAGATGFLELGPGSALSEMAAGAYRDVPARSLEEFKTLQGARSWLFRQGYTG
jgi:[acyl-carrier-protein] S-malonyltransferase